MKVLLLQDVKKVGRKNEVKDVSDGYARNFLFAQKLAVPADEGAMKVKARIDANEQALIDGYKAQAAKLKKDVLEFKVKAGQKGEVFGSVSAEDIRKALEAKGYHDAKVRLEKPIRQTGVHDVEVDFGKGVKGIATIKISAE